MITITLHTDNSAFEEDPATEVARILEELARRYRFAGEIEDTLYLRDINGNRVGVAKVEN